MGKETEMMTISEVSRQFDISARMLRYYEKEGLLESTRVPDYSYRVYTQESVKRLQQILILRKLRIPVKQIASILEDDNQKKTLEIISENLAELNEEIEALTVVRDILKMLVEKLDESIKQRVHLELLEDKELLKVIHVLNPSKTNLRAGAREGKDYMGELTKANEVLESKMDIRFVYLPPATVASSQYIGKNPEDTAGARIYSFIKEKNLPAVKPDFRLYGFNNPSPQGPEEVYGYEFWVTIPEDMEVAEPLVKKKFDGGLYAAHCIKMGDFHEWQTFTEVMQKHEEYEINWREPYGMGGCLEEELNIYHIISEGEDKNKQLDLLIPIKRREGK